VETVKRTGFEVGNMVDPIDEYCQGGLDMDDEDEKKLEELTEPLSELMKEGLGDKVRNIVVSSSLADSPCILATSKYSWSANMKLVMKATATHDSSMTSTANTRPPKCRRILRELWGRASVSRFLRELSGQTLALRLSDVSADAAAVAILKVS
jgi:HSP90 family molecular chaperone